MRKPESVSNVSSLTLDLDLEKIPVLNDIDLKKTDTVGNGGNLL